MQVDTFIELTDKILHEARQIQLEKGREYTVSDNDKFKNFKSIADRMKTTPKTVAMIYLLKHMDSIRNYVLTGTESSSETIDGRIIDAINYLLLLYGIIYEEKQYQDLDAA
jgi:hypothetical protein